MSGAIDQVRTDTDGPSVNSDRGTWWNVWSPLLGVAASALVLLLRYAGLLGGVSAVGMLVLCFIFAPGPRRVADRFLLLFGLAVGWLPLVGWVPGLGNRIDVPGVVLAIGVGVACWHQFRGNRSGARTVTAPTVAEAIALITGATVTLWWARPFARLSYGGILQALLYGGDNVSHFSIFRSNLQLGSFTQVRPNLAGGVHRLGYDYPQGVHQAWAQFTRLLSPHPSSSSTWLLHSYLDVLLLTVGGIVVLGCMSICRLCRRDLVAGVPAMAVVVALFGVGRFGPFNGFPNYELAVAAAATAVTLMVRPSLGPRSNFFAVAGMGLIVVYNWYPVIILIAPAIVIAATRARSVPRGRGRQVMTVVVGATAVAYVLPFVTFLHRGVSFLNVYGSGIAPPWGLLTICIVALIGVVIVRQASHPDLPTNLIVIAPALLGGIAVVALAAFEARSVGSISYYGQKFAAGVLGVCLTVLVCVIAGDCAASQLRRRIPTPLAVAAAALLSVAALQVDGYVGPYYGVLESSYDAPGIAVHNFLAEVPSQSLDAAHLLSAAKIAHAGRTKDPAEQWWYVEDPTAPPGDAGYTSYVLSGQWFLTLRGDGTYLEDDPGLAVSKLLAGVRSPSLAAAMIIRSFPDPIGHHVHLFVPEWLRHALIHDDSAWGRPGQLGPISTP